MVVVRGQGQRKASRALGQWDGLRAARRHIKDLFQYGL